MFFLVRRAMSGLRVIRRALRLISRSVTKAKKLINKAVRRTVGRDVPRDVNKAFTNTVKRNGVRLDVRGIKLDRRALGHLGGHPDVVQACIEVAEAISAEAQRNTPVGATGRARDSHRVVVDKSQNPPLVAAVAGGGDAFYYRYRFLEFGSAFRPR